MHLLLSLIAGLEDAGKEPPDAATQPATLRIVEAMSRTKDPKELSNLSVGLGAFGKKLPNDAAKYAASRIVDVMADTPLDWSQSFTLLNGLGALGEKLPDDAAKAGLDRVVDLIAANTIGMYEDTHMSETLGALVKKQPDDTAESTFGRIVDLMVSKRHSPALHKLAENLKALGEKLPPASAPTVADRIVDLMAGNQDHYRLTLLSRGLGAPGQNLSDDFAGRSLQSLLSALYSIPEPPCASATTLIRKANLQPIIDLLKWPTCSLEDRNQLIEKIGEVTGESFGREFDGKFQADLWTFIEWAAENGYDTDSPPRPP